MKAKVISVALLVGLIFAGNSQAAFGARTYDGQITGFQEIGRGLTVDANDNVWVSDPGNNSLISEFAPYPSIALKGTQSGDGRLSRGGVGALAVSSANGDLYVADSGPEAVDIFKEGTGAFIEQFRHGFGGRQIFVATDRSSPPTGRFYVSANAPGTVQAFEESGAEHIFSATASYISGNALTGTPSGPFVDPWNVASDSNGNIYVVDLERSVVDEFAPSGMFLREFTGAAGAFGVAVDPTNEDVLIVGGEGVTEFTQAGQKLGQFDGSETPGGYFGPQAIAVNSAGYVYVSDGAHNVVDIFTPNIVLPKVTYSAVTDQTQTSATLNAEIDPNGGGEVLSCKFEYGTTTNYGNSVPCSPKAPFSAATVVAGEVGGLASETTYHYRVVVTDANGTKHGSDQVFILRAVAGLTTEAASQLTSTTAVLNGSWIGNGEDTHYYFEWGETAAYGHETALPPGADGGEASAKTAVSVLISGLEPIATYHFRITASNSKGVTVGADESFTTPPAAPVVSDTNVTNVHIDTAVVDALINPGGGDTRYHVEYGTTDCEVSPDSCLVAPVPDGDAGSGLTNVGVSVQLDDLLPGTLYFYRVEASNSVEASVGPIRTFTTFPYTPVLEDSCANAHVRQQTGAALLLDCRAYELVSAANSGGYDVESSLVPNGAPYPGFPEATNPARVLYGVHDGGIPGTNHPTNRGVDPYIATRGESGWSTEYVGIPANSPFPASPFSSRPLGTSATLETFAFGGPGGCSPCFEGGYTGIPVRLPSGAIVQGMVAAGGVPTPGPTAEPDGYVAKDLSANGEHLVFGSTSRFAAGGNNETGDVSYYDHNLKTGQTSVISDLEPGIALSCLQGVGQCHGPGDANGISELDVSTDGSHILLGQKVATDADGNVYWRLYMNVNDSSSLVPLTPGAVGGVQYDGMTNDGSRVFFTTSSQLATSNGQDTDASGDMYEAELTGPSVNLLRLSVGSGGSGNTDSCDPVANSNGPHWNVVGSAENCSVVGIEGGAGVAANAGSVYFLSPEKLAGPSEGTVDQPNLYLAIHGGGVRFVATLGASDPLVVDSLKESATLQTALFQVSASGAFAAFPTGAALDEAFDNAGHQEVYRYDASTAGLVCVSCDPTGVNPRFDSSMASNGLSLTNDGRVFFTTSEPLVARDQDEKADAYEWEDGKVELISAGSSPFDSALLSVSADGKDVYFYTRDSLAPQDHNGQTMKIYDAREGGGFPYQPPSPPCAASDECHGAGSPAPAAAEIRTIVSSPGNVPAKSVKQCKKGKVRRHGKCVLKSHSKVSKHHKHHKRAAGHRGKGGK